MNKKKIIGIVAAVVITIITAVTGILYVKHQYYNRDFIYTKLEDGTLELTKYQGEDLIVIIPEEVKGRKVTSIGGAVFSMAPEGLQVYIPETVTHIGVDAFGDTYNLSITGARNVEVIDNLAFSGCSFVSDFPFSDKLRYIGDFAFFEAKGMGKVELPDTMESIGYAAFCLSDCEIINIPDGVEYIGSAAIVDCEWVEEQTGYVIVGQNILIKFPEEEMVIIPENVKLVSTSNDLENKKIKEIYIPNTVEGIVEDMIFSTETELRVYIPFSVKQIGGYYSEEDTDIILVDEDMAKLTLVVEAGSYAEEYAKQKAEEYGTKYEVVEKIEYPKESENK